MKTQPYICRVQIKNFRNFRSVDFRLNKRQVVIGENGVGKSNLLRALQLILDPTLSEKDRNDYQAVSAAERRALLAQYDFFVGETTLETDIFAANVAEQKRQTIIQVFNELTEGGEKQKEHFATELTSGQYKACLSKIEEIGKGRFAQRLATYARQLTPPEYIRQALLQIKAKVAKTKVEVQR